MGEDSEKSSQSDTELTEIEMAVSLSSPSTSSAALTDSNDANPWPFIDRYFTFTGVKGNNFEFKCIICLPKEKIISANKKSLYNLKKHVARLHPNKSDDVNRCIDIGIKEKKRSHSADSGADIPKKLKQQSIDQAIVKGSQVVTQSKLDTKIIAVFVDNMLPLEVSNLFIVNYFKTSIKFQ
jgi:hypothetical protein